MSILQTIHDSDKAGMPPPVPDPPEPGTYHLTFQKQLAATEHVSTLAKLLAHVHWLYEGWGPVPTPLGAELTRIYTKAACLAVRYCSEPERQVAESKAERWALDNFLQLRMDLLQTQDRQETEQLIRAFARRILDEQRFSLMQGCTELSTGDRITLAEME